MEAGTPSSCAGIGIGGGPDSVHRFPGLRGSTHPFRRARVARSRGGNESGQAPRLCSLGLLRLVDERSAGWVSVVGNAPDAAERPLTQDHAGPAVLADQRRWVYTPSFLEQMRFERLLIRKVAATHSAVSLGQARPAAVAIAAVAPSRRELRTPPGMLRRILAVWTRGLGCLWCCHAGAPCAPAAPGQGCTRHPRDH